MNHTKLLIVKFLATLAFLTIILGFGYGLALGNVFLISLVVGGLAYLIGDMLILPRTNNTVATIADFAIAFVVVFIMTDFFTAGVNVLTASFVSAVALSVFEIFYHQYVAAEPDFQDAERSEQLYGMNLNYTTEASEELDPFYDLDEEEDEEDF